MKTLAICAIAALSVTACATSYDNSQSANTDPQVKMAESQLVNIVNTSRYEFNETDRRLKNAIDSRDLKTFTVVNHGEGAKSAGMNIGMSKLYIFGNPKSGTPLMMDNRQMGLELPMKILIHTEGGDNIVHIAHPDISRVAKNYGIVGQDALLAKITATLHDIVSEAGG